MNVVGELGVIHVLWVLRLDGSDVVGWYYHPNAEALAEKRAELEELGLPCRMVRYVVDPSQEAGDEDEDEDEGEAVASLERARGQRAEELTRLGRAIRAPERPLRRPLSPEAVAENLADLDAFHGAPGSTRAALKDKDWPGVRSLEDQLLDGALNGLRRRPPQKD